MLSRQIKSSTRQLASLTFENYSLRALTSTHVQEGVNLLALEFTRQEPLSNGFYRKFEHSFDVRLAKWTHFWQMFADDFVTS